MTAIKRISGSVRFADSFPVPSSQQTVRVILTDSHGNKVDLAEFRAADVHKERKTFSFPITVNTEYIIWADMGRGVKLDSRTFYLNEEQELPPLDFLFD
jgi:hypothetical protein